MYCKYCMANIPDQSRVCPACGKELSRREPDYHLPVGTVLNGRFLVGAALGEGGFGITYIGRDTKLEMRVAIKEYYPAGYAHRAAASRGVTCTGGGSDAFEKGRKRFLDEARVLARFSDEDGVVNVRDFFSENNTAYIVMEFLDGTTLREHLKSHPLMSPEQAIHLLMPVMRSLERVHSHGLIHRDISPDNIMLLPGKVKLLDFGAARDVSGKKRSISVMLKPGYAPEEQYRSKGLQGPWTDVYALCATLYKCMTGITPDDATQRVYRDELKAPSALGIRIEAAAERALMKGLAVLQQDRYQSIGELLAGFRGEAPRSRSDARTVTTGYAGGGSSEGEGRTATLHDSDRTQTLHDTDRTRTLQEDEEGVRPGENAIPLGEAGNVRQGADADAPGDSGNSRRGGGAAPPGDPGNSRKGGGAAPPGGPGNSRKGNNTPPPEAPETSRQGDSAGPSRAAAAKNAKKKRGKKRPGTVFLILLVVVGIMAVRNGDFFHRDAGDVKSLIRNADNSLSINSADLTAEDLDGLVSLKDLETLRITGCTVDEQVLSQIASIPGALRTLAIENCTGLGNLGAISRLTGLHTLSLSGNDLTPEQLRSIDFTALTELRDLDVSGSPRLSDFTLLNVCGNLTTLRANNCSVSDLSLLPKGELSTLELSGNGISDLSPLKDYPLYSLEVNQNQISDLSALGGMGRLTRLEADENQLLSLAPLSGCPALRKVSVNGNALISLTGLESALELEELSAAYNELIDLIGLKNCTVLEEVDLAGNQLRDISPLAKSAATLTRVYLNDNHVATLAALEGAGNLTVLNFEGNEITSLGHLRGCASMKYLYGGHNSLYSTAGVEGMPGLHDLFLPYNQISDCAGMEALDPEITMDLDLSHNALTALTMVSGKEYWHLGLHDNPLTQLPQNGKEVVGYLLTLSYQEDADYNALKKAFSRYILLDCPEDQQTAAGKRLRNCSFAASEEADREMLKERYYESHGYVPETAES